MDEQPVAKRPRVEDDPAEGETPLVSVLTCCHNGEKWLDSMLQSLIEQTWKVSYRLFMPLEDHNIRIESQGPLELCVFDDASKDDTLGLLEVQALFFRVASTTC